MGISRWTVTPKVAALLGPAGLAQLDELDPAGPITCQGCGKVTATREELTVLATRAPAGAVVVAFAHPGCASRVGQLWPALQASYADGVDSLAVLGERVGGVRPRTVLAFEPQLTAVGVPEAGVDGVNVWVSGMLGAGFSLASVPLVGLDAPAARGWVLSTKAGRITLDHPRHGVAYTQAVDPDLAGWVRMARSEGACLVLTGHRLGIRRGGPLPDDFATARSLGLLVAATVAVR